MTAEPSPEHDIDRDARDLRRGVAVNLLGYLIKIGQPLLLYVVIRLYGSRDYGVFLIAQSTSMIALRVCLFGFDKGVLWWSARQDERSPMYGLAGVVGRVTAASAAVAVLLVALAPVLARWQDTPEAALGLAWMAVALLPMAWTELLASAAAGKRRMSTQVLVRDGFGALALTLLAVLAHVVGLGPLGLPIAFVLSKLAAFVAALAMVRRMGPLALHEGPPGLPPGLTHYAFHLWLTEIASAFAQRIDVLALASLAPVEAVGIYGGVAQIANTLRQIRQAFDPIVIAISAETGARRDIRRLRAGFSYATSLVIATQLPVYVFILLFAEPLMRLLGPGFEAGTTGVMVLSLFWIVNGVIGLNGHIVTGFGRSDLAFANMLVLLAIEAALLWRWIPLHGITGAALAVGVAYTLQNVLVAVQAAWLAGAWPYDRKVLEVLIVTSLAAAVGFAVWWCFPSGSAARVLAFTAFAVADALAVAWLVRRGVLYRSGTGSAAAAERA